MKFLLRRTSHEEALKYKHNWRAIDWIITMVHMHPDILIPYNGKSLLDTITAPIKKLGRLIDGASSAQIEIDNQFIEQRD